MKIPLSILKFHHVYNKLSEIECEQEEFHDTLYKWVDSLNPTISKTPNGLYVVTLNSIVYCFDNDGNSFIPLVVNNSNKEWDERLIVTGNKDITHAEIDSAISPGSMRAVQLVDVNIDNLPVDEDFSATYDMELQDVILALTLLHGDRVTCLCYVNPFSENSSVIRTPSILTSTIRSEFPILNNDSYKSLFTTTAETIESMMESYIDDPFIDPDTDLEDDPLEFQNGDEDEMTDILTTLYMAYNLPDSVTEIEVYVRSGSDEGSCCLDEDVSSSLPEEVVSKMQTIIDWFNPTGSTWEYNDGAYDRQSGYDKNPRYIYITLRPPVSFHEQLSCQEKIKQFFIKNNLLPGVNLDEFFSFHDTNESK